MQTSPMKYYRLSENYNINTLLPITKSPYSYPLKSDKPYFISMLNYNENTYNEWQKTKSLKKQSGGTTTKLWADFDGGGKAKPDTTIEQAFIDANTFLERLHKLGLKEENIQISFSGNKGVGFIVELDKELSIEQVHSICLNLAKDLKTFDHSMYDHQRIFRLLFTRHEVSGLYKIPLTEEELKTANISEIKEAAKSLDNFDKDAVLEFYKPFTFNKALQDLMTYKEPEKKESNKPDSLELDYSKKPSQWRNCKWSLLQGKFEAGNRHQALMVIAATARGLGYDKDTAYYLCKSALKKQAALTGQEEFSKEELYTNIIEDSVFTDSWDGGQYTCTKSGWLQNYCTGLGEHSCKNSGEDEPSIVSVDIMSDYFTGYASEFEKNVIKTGIKGLDDNAMLCVSTLNGLLGQPGSGKTSMSINYLCNTSLAGIPSTFFSLDMGMPIVMAKLVQKQTGISFKSALELYKNDKAKASEISARIRDDFKNVGFNFKSGLTVPDIKSIVQEQEQQAGNKVKLVVIDYLECLAGPYSDATANTGFLANQLKDLANDLSVCVLLLLQTQKHSTPDISDPLLSLRNIKGSSLVEQSMSTILTMWRDGYNPKTVDDDKYVSFAIVKNRFGSLWSGDFAWDGVTGNIRGLAPEEYDALEDFRNRKQEDKLKALKEEKENWS